jgi:hypothetical protein
MDYTPVGLFGYMATRMDTKAVLSVQDDDADVFLMQCLWQRVGIPQPLHIVRDAEEAINYLAGAGQFTNRAESPFPALCSWI